MPMKEDVKLKFINMKKYYIQEIDSLKILSDSYSSHAIIPISVFKNSMVRGRVPPYIGEFTRLWKFF